MTVMIGIKKSSHYPFHCPPACTFRSSRLFFLSCITLHEWKNIVNAHYCVANKVKIRQWLFKRLIGVFMKISKIIYFCKQGFVMYGDPLPSHWLCNYWWWSIVIMMMMMDQLKKSFCLLNVCITCYVVWLSSFTLLSNNACMYA